MNNNNNSQVYVDLNALADWANKIQDLNSDANDILKAFETTIDDLDNYWKGKFADGFIKDSTNFTQKAKKCHNSMTEVPMILNDIITVKQQS